MRAAAISAGPAISRPSPGLKGAVFAPGDKSISHRALILGAMADGETTVEGLLEGDDVLRTAAALRALGAGVERIIAAESGAVWRVEGARWRNPGKPLYFGNSGTGCRLMMGAVAGRGAAAAFDGDASLRRRPMERILAPLRDMGAVAESRDGRLPVSVGEGARLAGIDYRLPAPSAQIKSAVLLAGLGATGDTVIREPHPCRDHTERMLPVFGVGLEVDEAAAVGRTIRLRGGQALKAASIKIPGDPSSVAFIIAAALITPGSEVVVRNVLVNPLRAGFYETLRDMGAEIGFENARVEAGEPVADIRARHSQLKGVGTQPDRAPSMIDEYPILAAVAAFAEGETHMAGLGELRAKESDRIAATEAGLAASGVGSESGADWLKVFGRGGDVPGGGRVVTLDDHRIAMSFLVMGIAAQNPVEIDDASMIATSYPDFFIAMSSLGAQISI